MMRTRLEILTEDRAILFQQVEAAIRNKQEELLTMLKQRIRSVQAQGEYYQDKEEREKRYVA
jgi:hypothetical protein